MKEYQLKVVKKDEALVVYIPGDVTRLFGENVLIAIGKSKTLRLYHTKKYWETLPARLETMPLAQVKMLRGFISNSSLAAIGRDGEIEIPCKLCAYAMLDENVNVKLIVDETQKIADIIAMK